MIKICKGQRRKRDDDVFEKTNLSQPYWCPFPIVFDYNHHVSNFYCIRLTLCPIVSPCLFPIVQLSLCPVGIVPISCYIWLSCVRFINLLRSTYSAPGILKQKQELLEKVEKVGDGLLDRNASEIKKMRKGRGKITRRLHMKEAVGEVKPEEEINERDVDGD